MKVKNTYYIPEMWGLYGDIIKIIEHGVLLDFHTHFIGNHELHNGRGGSGTYWWVEMEHLNVKSSIASKFL